MHGTHFSPGEVSLFYVGNLILSPFTKMDTLPAIIVYIRSWNRFSVFVSATFWGHSDGMVMGSDTLDVTVPFYYSLKNSL